MVYVIGSLRNPKVPKVSNVLREQGLEVFDDWFAAGPEADDYWQAYEKAKGSTYAEGLAGWAAQDVFEFDRTHLNRCEVALLVLPAGKSGHLELGYIIGQGKPGLILLEEEEPERWDVMYNFASKVCSSIDEVIDFLKS